MATNVTSPEENLFSECELTETIETDIEKWIGESKLSVINMPHLKHNDKPDSSNTLTRSQNESNALVQYYGKQRQKKRIMSQQILDYYFFKTMSFKTSVA